MVIFQYNHYIFGIHLWTVLYPKPRYNEPCYKEVVVYFLGRLFTIEPWYAYTKISLRLLSTWLSLTNVIKPRIRLNPGLSLWLQSAFDRGLSVKPGLGPLWLWQTVQTQIRCCRMRHLISVCTVCLNYWKLRVNWNSSKSCLRSFSQPETTEPSVLSVLWFTRRKLLWFPIWR